MSATKSAKKPPHVYKTNLRSFNTSAPKYAHACSAYNHRFGMLQLHGVKPTDEIAEANEALEKELRAYEKQKERLAQALRKAAAAMGTELRKNKIKFYY